MPAPVALVIDTSSILAICKTDESSKDEEAAISGGIALVAPFSVRGELVNALANAIRKGETTHSIAHRALVAAMKMPITYVDINQHAAIDLSVSRDILAYDACVIQCAEQYKLPLLTSEKDTDGFRQMTTVARSLGIQVVRLKKWQVRKTTGNQPRPKK